MAFRWLTIFLDFPASDSAPGVAFWRDMTGSTLSPSRGQAGEFATLLPSAGDACLRVQRTADGAGGCHLDLHVDTATEPLDQAAARAGALGASVRYHDGDLVIADSPAGSRSASCRGTARRWCPGRLGWPPRARVARTSCAWTSRLMRSSASARSGPH
jgi:hypothetical protein